MPANAPENYKISATLNFAANYNPLESQVAEIQTINEPEDPPETLHTPWGVWLHHRDPLHRIEERFDAAHLIRTARAAEDILHLYHYVPIIGEYEPAKPHTEKFEYEHAYRDKTLYFGLSFGEDAEREEHEFLRGIVDDVESIFDELSAKPNNEEAEDEPKESIAGKGTKNYVLEIKSEKSLLKIVEKMLLELLFKKKQGKIEDKL